MGTIEKMRIEAEKAGRKSLFDDDEDYVAQCEEGDQQGLVDSAINFINLKTVKTCENCSWNSDGLCRVMQIYNENLLIPVGTSEKCTHWKKIE